MTEKRFIYCFEGIEDKWETVEEYKYTPCTKDGFQDLCVMLNELNDENEQLKQRNENQYNQLNELWKIIEEENWEKLIAMKKQLKEDEERLRNEWKCYE